MQQEVVEIQPAPGSHWTVLGVSHHDAKRRLFLLCRCKCGTQKPVHAPDLKAGKTKSCGCHKSAVTSARNYRHGMRHKPEWNVWNRMKQRCTNNKNPDYPDYGGRGITVSESWLNFKNFIADMGERPSAKHSLERKEVNGHYCRDNCVWLLKSRQGANTRRTRSFTINGKTQNLSDWSRETGVAIPTILGRIKLGWEAERAITEPTRSHSWHAADDTLSKEKSAWSDMKYRCSNSDNADYGGRGISVCDRWLESFEAFFADVGPAPSSLHSLERKSSDGNYEPGNVVWATRTTQNRNRRTKRVLTHDGVSCGLSEWAEKTGIPAGVIRLRLDKHKWDVSRALTTPVRVSATHKDTSPQPPMPLTATDTIY